MRLPIVGALFLSAVASPLAARAQEPGAESPEVSADLASERVATLRQEFEAAMDAFMESYQSAGTEEERKKLFDEEYPHPGEYLPRLWDIVDEFGTQDGVVEALVWITQLDHGPDQQRALERLGSDFVERTQIADACSEFGEYTPNLAAESFLRKVVRKNPDHRAQGLALYALAGVLRGQADLAGKVMGGEPLAEELDAETLAKLKKSTASSLRADALEILHRIEKEYADIERYGRPLGDVVRGDLFEAQHLGIGQVAPDIEGTDFDGVAFKLSDYRGKVVMLDFWGNW